MKVPIGLIAAMTSMGVVSQISVTVTIFGTFVVSKGKRSNSLHLAHTDLEPGLLSALSGNSSLSVLEELKEWDKIRPQSYCASANMLNT